MATSIADYQEGLNKKLLRDMRSDVKAECWRVVKIRANMILEIDPDHKEAQDCLKQAEAALPESPQQETV